VHEEWKINNIMLHNEVLNAHWGNYSFVSLNAGMAPFYEWTNYSGKELTKSYVNLLLMTDFSSPF
jgi:hypothetical protein